MGQDGPIPTADKGKGRAIETPPEEPGVVDDLIAGWIGGAVGILASQSKLLETKHASEAHHVNCADLHSRQSPGSPQSTNADRSPSHGGCCTTLNIACRCWK